MITTGLMSSNSNEWATPQGFYDELHKEFNFNLDPCSTHDNKKCDTYYTKAENGLLQDWGGYRVFVNPPYGRDIKDWVKKSYEESLKPNTQVVMLIPARTDTTYFHDYIYGKAELRFIRGRLKFVKDGIEGESAPFPSMVVIFKGVIE